MKPLISMKLSVVLILCSFNSVQSNAGMQRAYAALGLNYAPVGRATADLGSQMGETASLLCATFFTCLLDYLYTNDWR